MGRRRRMKMSKRRNMEAYVWLEIPPRERRGGRP